MKRYGIEGNETVSRSIFILVCIRRVPRGVRYWTLRNVPARYRSLGLTSTNLGNISTVDCGNLACLQDNDNNGEKLPIQCNRQHYTKVLGNLVIRFNDGENATQRFQNILPIRRIHTHGALRAIVRTRFPFRINEDAVNERTDIISQRENVIEELSSATETR